MNITLCLTHDCNLRCTYCYAGRKFRRRMPWAVARAAIDLGIAQTRAAAPGTSFQLGFFGGEPLLEWNLLTRATAYAETRATDAGLPLQKTLTTNATLLTPARVDYLQEHGFHLGLSIDGHRAMHDLTRPCRNGRSSHARATALLKRFTGPNAPAEVIVTFNPHSVRHLPEAIRWLAAQDICNVSLNPDFYVPWPAAARRLWRRGYEAAAAVYLENYRRPRYYRINFIDGKIRTRLRDGYRPCDRCSFGEREIAVAPSGNLYPCERLVGADDRPDLRLGNVTRGLDPQRQKQILAHRGNRNPECRGCNLRPRCMNWCGCINLTTTGATDTVPGIVCFHERLAIELADQVAETLYAESNPHFLRKFYDNDRV